MRRENCERDRDGQKKTTRKKLDKQSVDLLFFVCDTIQIQFDTIDCGQFAVRHSPCAYHFYRSIFQVVELKNYHKLKSSKFSLSLEGVFHHFIIQIKLFDERVMYDKVYFQIVLTPSVHENYTAMSLIFFFFGCIFLVNLLSLLSQIAIIFFYFVSCWDFVEPVNYVAMCFSQKVQKKVKRNKTSNNKKSWFNCSAWDDKFVLSNYSCSSIFRVICVAATCFFIASLTSETI